MTAWPGSPGAVQSFDGAHFPWGESIAIVVRAALLAGRQWVIGPDAADKLDDGNVLGPLPTVTDGRLWVDLAQDTVSLEVIDSSTTGIGVVSRDEAMTLTLELFDPDRIYDPANVGGPYWLSGRTKLTAGTHIEVTIEVLDGVGGVLSYPLFAGQVDTWVSGVQLLSNDRRAKVTASGAIKLLANLDFGQVDSPVGAADTSIDRIDRVLTRFSWPGVCYSHSGSTVATMPATTFQGTAWQLIQEAADAEIGFVRVTPDNNLQFYARSWLTSTLPATTLTLAKKGTGLDITTDVQLAAIDDQLRNAVYANRSSTGPSDTPVVQIARETASIDRHGGSEALYRVDNLKLVDDAAVLTWADAILVLFAYPTPAPKTVIMLPARNGEPDGAVWRAVLRMTVLQDIVQVIWEPNEGSTMDTLSWIMGTRHTITPSEWKVQFDLIPATRGSA